ncbi:MAG TPA: metallophosphoesterase family protein, partial [Nitrospira sp.]|nr:metallophosphoesterase family protein [Nitrospira sp.]
MLEYGCENGMVAVKGRETGTVRMSAVGDLHCPRTSLEELRALFHELSNEADVLLLCGDLTDYGKPDEARLLVDGLALVRPVPIL